MIIDSHAHVFPPMSGAAGHRTVREHMRYLQAQMAVHHQPVRQADDVKRVMDKQMLVRGHDYTLDGLTDVNFRARGYGRFMWTTDGIDYYKQYLPPTLTNLEATPELMIAQMDYLRVDRAVLQMGHFYGELNDHLGEAVQRFPNRFWALAQVSEWRIDRREQMHVVDHALDESGLHALWFDTCQFGLHGRQETVDDPTFHPFWDHVRERRIPVFWNVTSAEPGKKGYLTQFAGFARWLKRYPEVPSVLTHGVPLFTFWEGDSARFPEEVWETLSVANLMTEILYPIRVGGDWDYPYARVRPLIRQLYQRLGPEKLAWGSDMPNVERHCTYRQSLDYLRSYCDFIPPRHMDLICGGNVVRLFSGNAG
jgi:predicted TIM-barrel fold metal-dependent hydrolase